MNSTAKESSNWVVLTKLSASAAVVIVDLRFLLFFSSRRNFKFLRAKKEAQEAFDEEIVDLHFFSKSLVLLQQAAFLFRLSAWSPFS